MYALKGYRRNKISARRQRWTGGGFSLFSLLIALSLALAVPWGGALAGGPAVTSQEGTVLPETPPAPDAITATYTENNPLAGTISDGASGQTGCAIWTTSRYFLVDESYTINDLNVRFNASHGSRGEIQVTLISPAGTKRVIVASSGDTNDDYDILLDGDIGGVLNDGNSDNTADPVDRTVLQAFLNDFEGENAHGAWQMSICDTTNGTAGTINAATQLVFDGTAVTPIPLNHAQGPAFVETYYLPFPEDQLWTAMGTIFTRGRSVGGDTCTDYRSYDADPRQPFINYIGVTIPDAGTVVAYDHWEDGYEANLTYPTQTTTQVWGDGDLNNGVAPKDADDLLVAGQILILNDAMLTTTLQTIVDFDARDKIGASKPIAVTRSGWSDGSQTMFAAADEVYPTNDWGIEYRLPVGEDADLYQMFEYTGVSVMAAVDGTVVSIDKNADGTAEQTCNLNQGGSCQWDDGYSPVIGNGLNRGSKITSNSNHPIQVSLLTGDYCAGFSTRSYTLLPVADWSSSYYSPVGTITSNAGPGGDDAPTTISLYNPNSSVITVNYIMGPGGSVQSVTLGPRLGTTVVQTNLLGAHFYSNTASAGNYNARDQFDSQSFDNSDGTLPWSTDWDETGDGTDSPTAGSIQINNNLRFSTDSASDVGDTIERQVDLSGASAATLSFSQTNNNTESGDQVVVEVSSNGGSSWTQVGPTLAGNSNPPYSQSILGYASANTRIRFRISARSGDSNSEYLAVDNVDINATFPGAASALPFYAVGSVDSDLKGSSPNVSSAYDWGFTLIPEKRLTQYLIAGWAPGDDPSFLGTGAENTAPLWLTGGHPTGSPTPNATYSVCIDDGGNGGPNTDPLTGRTYNRTIAGIQPRQQLKVYNGGAQVAGEDQTGTQIWVCDGSDAVITAAWGADPLTAEDGKPGLDMGFTIRNQRAWRAVKSAALQVDLNGNGLYDEGDTIRYTITVANTSAVSIPSLTVTDTQPLNVTYIANSTSLTNDGTPPPASGAIPDAGGTPFPLDEGGYTYTSLDSFKTFVITYDVTINTGASSPPATVTNVAHVTDGTLTLNPDVTITVQPPRPGDIGNYVWLDEDGDGDQDAGEAGIPNATVQLCADAACTSVLATTTTDANGGYLFPDRNPGTYYVKVTPPAGMNQTYDENGALDNTSQVVLTPGQEYLAADFGYNWSTPAETNNPGPGATGAIGDKVWVDVDPDGAGALLPNGILDPGEVGLAGVTVQLYTAGPDGLFGTGDDVLYASDVTDANGDYLFDNLPADAYVVKVTAPSGYSQSGDPDQFGVKCTTCDNQTTAPIVLGPGDVFVNADFGYTPTSAAVGSIGDTLWLDADRGGDIDASEPRLPGVTVSLIKDTNGNGAWDPGEPIIATDVTDANGQYLFSGVPASGTEDYLVWVNDTNNVLGDLVPTYDASAPANGLSSVLNLTSAGNLTQDFGYAPSGHDAGEGLIGDTVFIDLDADGAFDAGEGQEGVMVKLFAADGVTLLAVTTTNENGQYFFGGLPAATYVVQVQAGTLPYTGLTNTVDPDGGNNSTSTVVLPAGGVNLAQDFGYRDTSSPNTIGGTLWNDSNADGTLTEPGRFAGVTVVLRDASGDVVATTTTDPSGNYSFTNLPDGTYTVDVTDDANVLNGYWKSAGTNPGNDNNSQVDPYTVTVSGGQTNTTADFGYYQQPAALGNFVWEDLDGDGVQDAGEPGVPGVPVTLTITWPNGAGTTTLKTTTDASGFYSFANLLQDEDYPASGGAGQPALSVSIATPAGFANSPQNQTTEGLDSDNPSGEAAIATKGSANNDYDFGLVRYGSIGNYVWLDEDGDGDQDAGEAGIPNATVQLCADAACTSVLQTTTTDANGGYLFSDVPRGTYYVKVTPPAGLNPTYDENGPLDNTSQVVLSGSGQEHLTADFGYNWSTSTETNNPGPGATGAIGDKVWVDVDPDGAGALLPNGILDPGEVGLAGVTVQLYTAGPDGLFGTGDDVLYASDVTDANGDYLFDNLPAGAYEVRIPSPPAGYNQSGDPDQFGLPCTTCDSKTTNPIVLAPGDVFVNADFGYTPTSAAVGSIGDTLWLDADRGGDIDASEPRLPGVTVSLIKDTNGNGAWDPGEPIIATDVTDANGQYLFSGVPASGTEDYLVWVNDTNNVLGDLVPTYDSNGVGTPNLSAVANLTGAGNLNQDFGYAPSGHDAGEGLIGDTIFMDLDADGAFDAGEGQEGVLVRLYAADGVTLLAATTTNENGQYFFGSLNPTATYVVKVDPATLPAGVTNTVDPDGGTANQSTVNLGVTGPVNLNQDFGYRDTSNPNTISGTIWNDSNADGTLTEPGRFAGVTVVLRDASGDVIATTTTDASGNYSFTNLPDGTYTVDVTDDANVLNGYWKSTGTNPGNDNNSQVDPYTVTVSGGQTNPTADFGYYQQPAALGNWLWIDDGDGIQESGENPLTDWPVTLTITYPNGDVATLKTTTDANGFYSFANLLQDEDFDGAGAGEPTFTITTPIPVDASAAPANQGGNDALDSDGAASGGDVTATVSAGSPLVKGATNPDYDFGFVLTPTNLTVFPPVASVVEQTIAVDWKTYSEVDIIAFNLYRSLDPNAAPADRSLVVSQMPVKQPGKPFGNDYQYIDSDVQAGQSYTYWLVVQFKDGATWTMDPTTAELPEIEPQPDVDKKIFLPAIRR